MNILKRFYSDYLMPSRLDEYDRLIANALEQGYEIISVIDYFHRLQAQNKQLAHKVLINRHDIDTDIKTARRFFEIEKKHGVYATYYFRLKTVDLPLMREIHSFGSEVGYHFEELATYAKQHSCKDKAILESHIREIRIIFRNNFRSLEQKLGFKILSVASHGDFANRVIGTTNHPVTNDMSLRKELGIEVEAYDDILLSSFDIYLSDRVPPVKFVPMTPKEAMAKGYKTICMLTHPRQWHSSWTANTKENIVRMVEGWRWQR